MIVHQFTEKEYAELIENKPSTLLQKTNSNLTEKLAELETTNKQLHDELQTYVLGGATKHLVEEDNSVDTEVLIDACKLIYTYNAACSKAVKASVEFTAEVLGGEESSLSIKQALKRYVSEGIIVKVSNNKYSMKG